MAAWNPLLILILVPTFSLAVYPAAERLGARPTPLRCMSVGMVLTSVSFLIIAALQVLASPCLACPSRQLEASARQSRQQRTLWAGQPCAHTTAAGGSWRWRGGSWLAVLDGHLRCPCALPADAGWPRRRLWTQAGAPT